MENIGSWRVACGLIVIGTLLLISGGSWKASAPDASGSGKMLWTGGFLLAGGIVTALVLAR